MATNYPYSLDNLANPATTDPVNEPSHASQHANANDAIEALEAKVGITNSLVTTSHDYRISQLETHPTYTDEMAQDASAALFTHTNHVNISATYDDVSNQIILAGLGGIASKISQEVVNNTGGTLYKGQAVYANGAVGSSGQLRVGLSYNTIEAASSKTFGIMEDTVADGAIGTVITEGLIEGLDTSSAQPGDSVWLGPTPGSLVFGSENKPYAPAHLVFLGIVTRAQQNTGSIFVKVQNGFELDELHDVYLNGKQNNQVLRYDSATGLWKNQTIDNLFDPAGSAASAVSAHEADTTNIHGIADTSLLATKSYVSQEITGLASQAYVDQAITGLSNTSDQTYVPISDVGNPDGVASLDSTGNIPLEQLGNLVDGAPTALNTLNELAAALGDNANYAADITSALGYKAPLQSPIFTGVPAAPTAAVGTNSAQIATTAYVKAEIDSSVQPGSLYQISAPTSPEIGQIWIHADEDVTVFDSNIIRRKSFIATGGETTFTTDIPFIDGFEQVYFNGLMLVKGTDYSVSGSNQVILSSAAAASDVIEVITVTGAASVNTYTQAEVDALLAANTSVAPLSISDNTNLLAKKRYFVTSASALTLTLPASPALNDEIQILDASGNASTYNITVSRNGNKINGGTGNLIIDTNGGWYTLLYTGSTYGWKVG